MKKRSTLAVLRLARKLLARGPAISKDFSARDRFRTPVHWGYRAAVYFCPVGAVYRAAQELYGARAIPITPKLIADDVREQAVAELDAHLPAKDRRRGISLPRFADERPRSQVLAMFDRAIEDLEPRRIEDDDAA